MPAIAAICGPYLCLCRPRCKIQRGMSLSLSTPLELIFSGILLREHCAMGARVVITIVLRVRALRAGYGNLSGAASARRLLMPARETEAIILKTFPLGEADRLVSFLGRSSG